MISGGFSRGNPSTYWHSIDTQARGPIAPQGFAASGTLPDSTCIYVPLMIRTPVVVKQLWYANMTTATGNYDIGLYDDAGVAILRKGSTAKSTSAVEIVWDCTDTTIGKGIYYIALATDSATDTFYRFSVSAPYPAALGIWAEAAFPLPATATFAVNNTLDKVPVMGLFLDTRVT